MLIAASRHERALRGALCVLLLFALACTQDPPRSNGDLQNGFSIPLIDAEPAILDAHAEGAMSDTGIIADSGSAPPDGPARDLSQDSQSSDSTQDTHSADSRVDTTEITYAWQVGPWSACSSVCNGGTRTRTVECENSLGETAIAANCTEAPPAASESCNTAPCIWVTTDWSPCSANCDGGTKTRSVLCETSGGVTVADSNCTSGRPPSSQTCNTQPCCTTDALVAARECTGTVRVQWFPYESNSGSAADRAACASQCTSYAKGKGYSSWCCLLYEDSGAGTTWTCRTYTPDGIGGTAKPNYYGSQGRCDSP